QLTRRSHYSGGRAGYLAHQSGSTIRHWDPDLASHFASPHHRLKPWSRRRPGGRGCVLSALSHRRGRGLARIGRRSDLALPDGRWSPADREGYDQQSRGAWRRYIRPLPVSHSSADVDVPGATPGNLPASLTPECI